MLRPSKIRGASEADPLDHDRSPGPNYSVAEFAERYPSVESYRRSAILFGQNVALNGYQKGRCFYCSANISIVQGAADLGDVDHVFPHLLGTRGLRGDIDGIWNLVLACATCNRGVDGKFERVPVLAYVRRLHRRNEFLIDSHHPLRETLILQTGASGTSEVPAGGL